jgi:hypothetical protein
VLRPVPVGSKLALQANPTYKGVPKYSGAWSGCAYDPELPGPICHTDQARSTTCIATSLAAKAQALQLLAWQVLVPGALQEVVRAWTRAVVREQPKHLEECSAQWFSAQAHAGRGSDASTAGIRAEDERQR